MNDSRKEDRLPVALVMRYREPTMLDAREGQCQNISQSGMCVLTPKPSPRGALIRFECVSGGSVEGIRGTGRVVWQRAASDTRGPAGMGVRFVRLEPGCVEALEDLLEQLGRERQPSSVPPAGIRSGTPPSREATFGHAAPQNSNPKPVRPGQATHVILPASGLPPSTTGATQQGMGAARNRSVHHPTLRGMPSSSSPPSRDGASSTPPESTTPAASGGQPGRSSPRHGLASTLQGHATIVGVPDPQRSAPLEAEGDRMQSPQRPRNNSGVLRDRLDRTRRGMPAPEAGTDAPAGQPAWPTDAASDRPAQDRGSERPGARDGAEESGSGREDGGHHGAPPNVPYEPPDPVAARRRAARAAEISSMVPALPDPDVTPKRNWIPWVVVGSGLLFSALIVSMFGTLPPGPFGKRRADVDGSANTGTPPDAPQPPATDTPTAASPSAGAPAIDPDSNYVLEVASDPPGARVSAAGQWVLAPGTLQLGRLNLPIQVRAEFAGDETVTVTVSPDEFELDHGRRLHRVELKRPREATAEQATAAAAAAQTARDDAPASAPEAERTEAKAAAQKSKPERHARRPAEAKADKREPEPETTAEPPPGPRIAQPPVPIASSAQSPPAPTDTPSGAASAAAQEHSPASASERDRAEASSDSSSPLAVALECLARGDNACVIAALQNRARSERELAVLIETYRAVGNTSDAERYMRRYLSAHPNGKSAQKFERLLERR